jgi:hypothetical protein
MAMTTLNLHKKIMKEVNETAIRFGKSRRDIIVLLLMGIMRNHEKVLGGFTSVKYQPDDDSKNWHCFHINFKPDEYEYFNDLRKVCKCSVSLLVALAADLYIDEMVKRPKKNIDSYLYYQNYVIRRDKVDGIYCWHLYWGFPKKHLNSLRL